MKKQELCQLLEHELINGFNKLTINNICNYIWIRISKEKELATITLEELVIRSTFRQWMEQLKKGVPIQYVMHNACFYGLDLEVNTEVLIPRPETEELVFWILSDNKKESSVNLLDIGTGSGCIAIAAKKHRPDWNISAIDISKGALQVAKRNALFYNLNIEFIEADFLNDKIILKESYDLIVSNPPYISHNESDKILKSILQEPHIALFPEGNDPLVFYREIAIWAKLHLKKQGSIYLEMNEFLFQEIQEIFQNEGYSKIEIRKDLQEKKRMLKVQF